MELGLVPFGDTGIDFLVPLLFGVFESGQVKPLGNPPVPERFRDEGDVKIELGRLPNLGGRKHIVHIVDLGRAEDGPAEEVADEERIDAAIKGVQEPGSELTPIRQRYLGYLGWLEQPGVLSLRFEDLILARSAAFGRLLDYLEERGFSPRLPRSQAISILEQAIAPKKSGTFRKGKPGNWREHFTDRNIATFKEHTGDLLLRLGYESSPDW